MIEINPDCRNYILKLSGLFKSQDKDIGILFDLICEKSLLSAIEMLSSLEIELFTLKAPSIFMSIMERQSPAVFQLFKESLKIEARSKIIWETLLLLDQSSLHVIIFKVKFLNFIEKNVDAMSLIDASIIIYPESIDLLMLKAHVQKAMELFEQADNTILSVKDKISFDKFCVSKVAKYLIRYGSISEAQELIGKFVQKPNQKERMGDLHEMQAVWYLIEMADRLFKDEKLLFAACFYRKIELIFAEFIDDQLDFHGYSLRRMSFIEYINFLRFLDNELKKSEILKRAQIGLSQCLMKLTFSEDKIDSLSSTLKETSISAPFDDDVTSHIDFLRNLCLNQKNLHDYLHHICDNLMFYHPEDINALNTCLKIAMNLNAFLTVQKLALKLIKMSVNISDEIVNQINQHRCDDTSLWDFVPFLG